MADFNEAVENIAKKRAEQQRLTVMLGESYRIQETWPEAFGAGKCSLRSREVWATGTRNCKIVERELRRADGDTRQITEDEYKYIKGDAYVQLRWPVKPRNSIKELI